MASRAGAKTRSEKAKHVLAAATPTVSEIISGKFYESDWNSFEDVEETDVFVGEIVKEVVNKSIDAIYQVYIEKQLVPFTVSQAKDALVQIIELAFLSGDPGDMEMQASEDTVWEQDVEPQSVITDCWARGFVARLYPPELSATPVSIDSGQESEHMDDPMVFPEEEAEMDFGGKNLMMPTSAIAKMSPIVESIEAEISPHPPKGPRASKTIKRSSHTHLIDHSEPTSVASLADQAERLSDHTEMPSFLQSIMKVQDGRPPGEKDVKYDKHGNVINVVRLQADELPSTIIKPRYAIVDPSVEAAEKALEDMRTGRAVKAPGKLKSLPPVSLKKSQSLGRKPGTLSSSVGRPERSMPFSFVDQVELSPGVTITEGGHIRAGTKRQPKRNHTLSDLDVKTLKPVMRVAPNRMNPSDVLVDLPMSQAVTRHNIANTTM